MFSRSDITKLMQRWPHFEDGVTNDIAILIGIFTGLTIVAYNICLKYAEDLFWSNSEITSSYFVILIPAIGGLLVGIIAFFSGDIHRCNVPEVIEGTALHGGRISIRGAFREVGF